MKKIIMIISLLFATCLITSCNNKEDKNIKITVNYLDEVVLKADYNRVFVNSEIGTSVYNATNTEDFEYVKIDKIKLETDKSNNFYIEIKVKYKEYLKSEIVETYKYSFNDNYSYVVSSKK